MTRDVPRSPLRSRAWQRLATVHMDEGDRDGAWQAFAAAQRDAPDDIALGPLEVQLLVAERRYDDARVRAAFWARRLRRSDAADEWVLGFLDEAAENPVQAMESVGMLASEGVGRDFADWLTSVQDRPIPLYRAASAAEVPDDTGLGERLRKPTIDPHAVTLGGDDQAWLYRTEMREVWQATPGALSANAIRALNIGAKTGGFYHDTGEGRRFA